MDACWVSIFHLTKQAVGFVWFYSSLKWTHTHIPLNSWFTPHNVTQIVIGCGHDWHFNRTLAKHSAELRENSSQCMNMCLCVIVFFYPLPHSVATQTECAWNSDGLIEKMFYPPFTTLICWGLWKRTGGEGVWVEERGDKKIGGKRPGKKTREKGKLKKE